MNSIKFYFPLVLSAVNVQESPFSPRLRGGPVCVGRGAPVDQVRGERIGRSYGLDQWVVILFSLRPYEYMDFSARSAVNCFKFRFVCYEPAIDCAAQPNLQLRKYYWFCFPALLC